VSLKSKKKVYQCRGEPLFSKKFTYGKLGWRGGYGGRNTLAIVLLFLFFLSFSLLRK